VCVCVCVCVHTHACARFALDLPASIASGPFPFHLAILHLLMDVGAVTLLMGEPLAAEAV